MSFQSRLSPKGQVLPRHRSPQPAPGGCWGDRESLAWAGSGRKLMWHLVTVATLAQVATSTTQHARPGSGSPGSKLLVLAVGDTRPLESPKPQCGGLGSCDPASQHPPPPCVAPTCCPSPTGELEWGKRLLPGAGPGAGRQRGGGRMGRGRGGSAGNETPGQLGAAGTAAFGIPLPAPAPRRDGHGGHRHSDPGVAVGPSGREDDLPPGSCTGARLVVAGGAGSSRGCATGSPRAAGWVPRGG